MNKINLKKIIITISCLFTVAILVSGICFRNNQNKNNNFVLNMLVQTMLSRSLFVACNLNIADILASSGPQELDILSDKLNVNKKALQKLMGFLIQQGFFQETCGKFSNNQASSELCESHLSGLRAFLLHDDETRWNSYGNLEVSIKSGKPSFDQLYGCAYFEYLKKDPKLGLRFDQAMNTISESEEYLIAQKFNFSGVIADVGGGQGKLLSKILQNRPQVLEAILIDLPSVVANVEGKDPRMKICGGTFFEEIQVQANRFILKRILHDWDDKSAIQILKNIVVAMKKSQNSKLVIFEGILNYSDKSSVLPAIDLALLTIFGGEERSLNDFEKLIETSGLKIESVTKVSDVISAITCSLKN